MLPHTQISLESMRSNATQENYQNVGKLINPETLHICAHHLKKSFDVALQNVDQNEETVITYRAVRMMAGTPVGQ